MIYSVMLSAYGLSRKILDRSSQCIMYSSSVFTERSVPNILLAADT